MTSLSPRLPYFILLGYEILLPTIKNCFCGNKSTHKECCGPIIEGKADALNAEVLMRSRFSAYAIKNYQYILNTYALAQRTELSVNELVDSAQYTKWLALQVLAHTSYEKTAQVEFKAFYQVNNSYYVMHELSDFIFEEGKWFYTNGVMQKSSGKLTPKRNSQCLCRSGKKFKQCCGG